MRSGRSLSGHQLTSRDSDATEGKTWDQYGVMYRSEDFRLAERVNPRQPAFESPLYEQTRDNLFEHRQPMERQFPPVTFEADQAAQDAEIGLNLQGEVTTSLAKFVTGRLDPSDDGQWRDYTDRISKIGLQPYLEIPTYLVVDRVGLLNTRWAIILPAALAVWNMIITRTYFQSTIPEELVEAAKVDGCSDFGFFWRIVLPLSKPIIAVNLLFYAVAQWNSWFNALIYLTNEHLFPLQLVLRQILIQNNSTCPRSATPPS